MGLGHATAEIVLTHRMERSVLQGPRRANMKPFVVNGRQRYATCSGVAWLRGDHLAVVNLYGEHLRIYRFSPADGSPRLDLLHELARGVRCPEDVAVSPDASVLAITHSQSDDLGLTLHRLDPATLAPDAGVNLRRATSGSAFHGLRFSPDGRHLAFTRIGRPSHVEVIRTESPSGERTCRLENRRAPMMPKSVAFTPDGRFVAIPMSFVARSDGVTATSDTRVSMHRFDAGRGVIDPTPVAGLEGRGGSLSFPETCTFLPSAARSRHTLLICDQALDAVQAFEFDAEKCALEFQGSFVTGLSFPHGLDVSRDGRFVAVTNYGDDSVSIARVAPRAPGGDQTPGRDDSSMTRR